MGNDTQKIKLLTLWNIQKPEGFAALCRERNALENFLLSKRFIDVF